MKNNIKYAGIAAAALLTVAPVATPVVNSIANAQTVQAATDDLTTAQTSSLNKYFNMLNATTTSETSADFPSFADVVTNYGKKDLTLDQVNGLASVKKAGSYQLQTNDSKNINDAGVTFGVTGLVNGQEAKVSDFQTYANNAAKNGGTVTLDLVAYKNGTEINHKVLTFINQNEVSEDATSINVAYTSPVKVDVNSDPIDLKLTTSVDASAVDQNGKDIKITKVTPSQNIYKTSNAALTQDSSQLFTGSKFDQADTTYYQAVNITLDDSVDVQSIYNNLQGAKEGADIRLNDKQAVQANVLTGNQLKLVRAIQVGDKTTTPTPDPGEGEWVETDAPGVVTVNDQLAGLYNDDNERTSRSVAAHSAWQTDKYRTNSETGQKQYRVSTHEWVNATDVTFAAKDTSNTNGLGNITNLEGRHVVTLAGPSGFVYTLFKSDGSTASRGLAGETAWVTDKSATDAAGNTYYRVSTDEWVRLATGVSVN